MESFVFGTSALGMAIPAFTFGKKGPKVLVLGGVHGNEPEGVIAAHGLLQKFSSQFSYNLQITLIPSFNPDGVFQNLRTNGNGVDLNRNLPTKDWNPEAFNAKYPPGPHAGSEPENKALITFLDQNHQDFILSLHSWHPLLNVNGDCMAEAKAINEVTGYEIKYEMGYPTPGCLGTYTGLERNMPTLTYEIERGQGAAANLSMHVPAILKALTVTEKTRTK